MKKVILALLSIVLFVGITGCSKKEEAKQQSVVYAPSNVKTPQEIKQLEDIAKTASNNANAWITLGNALMDTSRFSEAVDAYQKALVIEPKNVDVRVDMGTCLRGSGKSDKAEQEYRKALQINPNHPNAHRNLGVVLSFDMNKKDEGIKEFEKYLTLMPTAQDAAQIRQTIGEIRLQK